MLNTVETILTTLPATSESERVLIVLIQHPGEGSHIEMRQQSFGEGIGWFTQSTVRLEPGQMAALRNSLGNVGSRRSVAAGRLGQEYSRLTPANWQPRVVQADSA